MDTFVDFEQSLNKAVNRLREALNDEAGQPRYVETVPRRGYRFIAPVTGLNSTEQPRPPVLPGSVSDAKPAADLGYAPGSISGARPAAVLAKKRGWLALGLSAGVILLAAISAWFWTHSVPAKTAGRSLTRLTTNGTSFDPAISHDGKMIADAAAVGGFNKDIWVQQVAGGKAIHITHEKEGAVAPAFSPDGSQIAYESHGGIYEMPALGGDARLIISDGFGPTYTPGRVDRAVCYLRPGLDPTMDSPPHGRNSSCSRAEASNPGLFAFAKWKEGSRACSSRGKGESGPHAVVDDLNSRRRTGGD